MRQPDNRIVVGLIFLFGLALRFWGIADNIFLTGDEFTFIPAAQNFIKTGHYEPIDWLHPPLNFYITVIGLEVFGNNPLGWRLLYVIFGSLSILMLMLLSQRLFTDIRVSWLAGVLFAIEPYHIQLSRTNFMEIVPVFFFLLYLFAIVAFLQGNVGALSMSGIPLGLAISGKWYFLIPAVCTAFFLALDPGRKDGNRLFRLMLLLSSGFTAFGIYMLLFYPWFQRGSGLTDFFIWQFDAYQRLQSLTLSDFLDNFFKTSPSEPWQWFIKPLITAKNLTLNRASGSFLVIMNNFPIWLMVLPSFAYLCHVAVKTRNRNLMFIQLLFLSTYLQFVIVRRPVFLYSSFPVLPFAYMLVAGALSDISGKSLSGRIFFVSVFFSAILWGIFLYPLNTNRMVPVALYRYLLMPLQ